MHEVLHLIYKNRDKIWRNYMTHTSNKFKHSWSQPKQWRIPHSYNLEVTTFIKHLIIELNTVDKNLVLSLLKFSPKKTNPLFDNRMSQISGCQNTVWTRTHKTKRNNIYYLFLF